MRQRSNSQSISGSSSQVRTFTSPRTPWVVYCLKRALPLREIVLLPGETDDVQWAGYGKIHWMIRTGKICKIIGNQFRRQEKILKIRNPHKTAM